MKKTKLKELLNQRTTAKQEKPKTRRGRKPKGAK